MNTLLPKDGGNPFLKGTVVPLTTLGESPYKVAKLMHRVVEFVPTREMFPKGDVEPSMGEDPYVSPEEYAMVTGVMMPGVRTPGIVEKARRFRSTVGKHRKSLDKFQVEFDGIYLRPKNTEKEELLQLTNFDFWVVELLERHRRDGSVIKEVGYVVLDHEDETQHIALTDYNARVIDRIISTFPDCCITHSNNGWAKSLLKEYASARYSDALRTLHKRVVYEYHGWEMVEGKHVYLSASRLDCECDCFIPDTPLAHESVIWKSGESILDIGRQVNKDDGTVDYCQTYRASLPFWLYLHMGYASKLFQEAGLNLQFILVIVGKSGSLKTSTCKAFAEPFHPEGMLRLESTPRAMELYRESCIDQTMIADDIFSQKGAVMTNLENIIRAFGDEVGRAKSGGAQHSDIIRSQVCGGCIVTSENVLETQQSSTLRYVTLRFEPNSIDPTVLRRFQEDQRKAKRSGQPSLVQKYFGAWIHWLERKYDEVVDFIGGYQPPELALRFKRHQQIYRAFSAIAMLVLQWGKETGAISTDDGEQQFSLWLDIIRSLMKLNEDMAIIAEPWQQFLFALQAIIGTGAVFLAYTKEEYEGNSGKFLGFKRLGAGGECEYVLVPEKTFAHVKSHMYSAGKTLIDKPMGIYRELCEHGIAKGYTGQANGRSTRNRYLKRIKLHGHLVEMLVIDADSMEQYIETMRGDAR